MALLKLSQPLVFGTASMPQAHWDILCFFAHLESTNISYLRVFKHIDLSAGMPFLTLGMASFFSFFSFYFRDKHLRETSLGPPAR